MVYLQMKSTICSRRDLWALLLIWMTKPFNYRAINVKLVTMSSCIRLCLRGLLSSWAPVPSWPIQWYICAYMSTMIPPKWVKFFGSREFHQFRLIPGATHSNPTCIPRVSILSQHHVSKLSFLPQTPIILQWVKTLWPSSLERIGPNTETNQLLANYSL